MNKAPQPVWVIPYDQSDMAPLPAIMEGGSRFAVYDRHKKDFGPMEVGLYTPYDSFEACRAAMIAERSQALRGMQDESRRLAASIEHIRTIPNATFPNVQREVREQGQQEQQEAQERQEKVERRQEEVMPDHSRAASENERELFSPGVNGRIVPRSDTQKAEPLRQKTETTPAKTELKRPRRN